jgi:hypothetical protein
MTQTQRSTLDWLVDLPENDITGFQRTSMTLACYGHEKIGQVLGFFFYEASRQAKLQHLDTKSLDCLAVTFTCEQDTILRRAKVSKKSLNTYIKQLTAWGYLKVDGYRHIYTVYFRAIARAIDQPPKAIPPKPRGKYAPKKEPDLTEQQQKKQQTLSKLQSQFVKLQSQMVNLQTRMVNLQIQMSNLQTSETAESASEQGLTPDFDTPRLLEEKDKEDSLRVEEQITEPFLVPTLPLRDEVSVNTSSYSHEPAAPSSDESEWLWETEGEEDIFSEDADPTEKRPVVSQGGNLAPEERRAPLESKDRREGENSNQHPAVKPPSSGPPVSPGQAARMREQPTEQYNPHEKPRQPTGPPTDLSSEASKPPLPDKTEGKGNRKKDAPLLCEPSTVRKLIDANRGYVLKEKGAIIHQNIVLREWSEQNPLEHYHEVMNHLKTCRCKNPSHQWWHKDEHWRYLDADNLAKLTPGVLSELGLVPKPELPPDIPMPVMAATRSTSYTPVMAARPR